MKRSGCQRCMRRGKIEMIVDFDKGFDKGFDDGKEIAGKHCGGCVRCKERTRFKGDSGYHCTMKNYRIDIDPEADACYWYWDREEQEMIDRKRAEAKEARRKELWAIYADKPPVRLPIVFDGFGNIPECPVCHEIPYSLEQCHWCGQRFIRDEAVERYSTPRTEPMICPHCAEIGEAHVSSYNGHRHFRCEHCGCVVME